MQLLHGCVVAVAVVAVAVAVCGGGGGGGGGGGVYRLAGVCAWVRLVCSCVCCLS